MSYSTRWGSTGESELARETIAALEGTSTDERIGHFQVPAVQARGLLAWCLSWQGDFPEAVQHVEAALRIAEQAGHPVTLIGAAMQCGLVYQIRGDVSPAIDHLERALRICGEIGYRGLAPPVSAFLGHAYTLAGRHDDAVPLLETSLKMAAEAHYRPCTALWTSWQADAYFQAGRLDEAQQTAERAAHHGEGSSGARF